MTTTSPSAVDPDAEDASTAAAAASVASEATMAATLQEQKTPRLLRRRRVISPARRGRSAPIFAAPFCNTESKILLPFFNDGRDMAFCEQPAPAPLATPMRP
ncbi:hypothetical protein [Phenylobacterium sp.]|uniref:hypothetical protein n=1 Tax=Phenylobacterium sp. TaxID=1871053 RepID=UPI0025D094AF|nr:hypothetical protein [Phenylobacterium sp.]